jgi:hypothetical protein
VSATRLQPEKVHFVPDVGYNYCN